tara:strand:+ start:1536 stop:2672 length:1137 start_codon:yes stop_codon:yes gene_type:complete
LQDHHKILKNLLSFDTTSYLSNLSVIKYIEGIFEKTNKFKIIKVYNNKKDKCSLLIKPKQNVTKGILFSGHIDTVPVTEQKWKSNPFKYFSNNNKIYGRGSTDMKSFLSVIISNMINLKSNFPICLSITHDEETGCEGIYNLLKYVKKNNISLPDKCIVGEPTMLNIVSANKGVEIIETVLKTNFEEGHSSNYNQKMNTITAASNMITYLQSLQNKIPKKNVLNCKPKNSSIHIGIVNGGTSHNIIPKKTSFRWELRYIKNDLAFVKKKFFEYQKKFIKNNSIAIRNIQIENNILYAVPGLNEKNQYKILNFMKNFNFIDKHHVSYGTEAGILQNYGLSTIIFGPGSIKQAHKPNEYITVSQINKFNDLIKKITNKDL